MSASLSSLSSVNQCLTINCELSVTLLTSSFACAVAALSVLPLNFNRSFSAFHHSLTMLFAASHTARSTSGFLVLTENVCSIRPCNHCFLSWWPPLSGGICPGGRKEGFHSGKSGLLASTRLRCLPVLSKPRTGKLRTHPSIAQVHNLGYRVFVVLLAEIRFLSYVSWFHVVPEWPWYVWKESSTSVKWRSSSRNVSDNKRNQRLKLRCHLSYESLKSDGVRDN